MKAVTMLKLVIVTVVFICGCTSSEVSPIGVWSNVQAPETVQFKATSGVFMVKDQPPLVFIWKGTDKNRFRIDINFQGSVRTLLGQISADSIVLEGSGEKATYSRVKQ